MIHGTRSPSGATSSSSIASFEDEFVGRDEEGERGEEMEDEREVEREEGREEEERGEEREDEVRNSFDRSSKEMGRFIKSWPSPFRIGSFFVTSFASSSWMGDSALSAAIASDVKAKGVNVRRSKGYFELEIR